MPVSAADRFSLPRVRFTAGYTFIAYRRHIRSIQVQCVHGTYDTVHHSSDNRISSTQEAPEVISCCLPQGDNHYNIHLGNPLVDPQEHLRLVIPHANVLRVTDRSAHSIGFCGFLVLIEMTFWYARMIFRSYAPTKCFLGKGKVSVLLEGYRFSPAITNFIISACGGFFEPISISPKLRNACNLLKYRLLYGFNLFFNMLTPIKKQGDEHIYILL